MAARKYRSIEPDNRHENSKKLTPSALNIYLYQSVHREQCGGRKTDKIDKSSC